MTPSETAQLLATVQAYDRRTVGEVDILAWHEALGDLQLGDCRRAVVVHYRESTDWLMPAHLRRLVRTMREDQAQRRIDPPVGGPKPPGWPGPDVMAKIEAARAKRRAEGLPDLASGLSELAANPPAPVEAGDGESEAQSA